MAEAREIRQLGRALGAEVVGVDLSKPLKKESITWIEQSFAQHPVLVFRNQNLDALQLAEFGRCFGRPRPHALIHYRHEAQPEVSWLRNVTPTGEIDWFGVKRATEWHTDSTYEDYQPRLAILHALEVPSSKGGTLFANMCAAYDALPETMKQKLAGLTGLHGRGDGPAGVRLYAGGELERRLDRVYEAKPHAAVRYHPATGRPILFVNPMHTHGFVGISKEESWPLIEELAAHATQDQFVYYHSWRVGDVLMWDELATMHRGAGDYQPNEPRVMLRTIVYSS